MKKSNKSDIYKANKYIYLFVIPVTHFYLVFNKFFLSPTLQVPKIGTLQVPKIGMNIYLLYVRNIN